MKIKCIERDEDSRIYCNINKKIYGTNKYSINEFKKKFDENKYTYYYIDKDKLKNIKDKYILYTHVNKFKKFKKFTGKLDQEYIHFFDPQKNKLVLILGAGEDKKNFDLFDELMKEKYGKDSYEMYFITLEPAVKYPNIFNQEFDKIGTNLIKDKQTVERKKISIRKYMIQKHARLFDHIFYDQGVYGRGGYSQYEQYIIIKNMMNILNPGGILDIPYRLDNPMIYHLFVENSYKTPINKLQEILDAHIDAVKNDIIDNKNIKNEFKNDIDRTLLNHGNIWTHIPDLTFKKYKNDSIKIVELYEQKGVEYSNLRKILTDNTIKFLTNELSKIYHDITVTNIKANEYFFNKAKEEYRNDPYFIFIRIKRGNKI